MSGAGPSGSWVWKHFSKPKLGNPMIDCFHCPRKLKYCGSSSSLANHLERLHKIHRPISRPPSKKQRVENNGEEANEDDVLPLISSSSENVPVGSSTSASGGVSGASTSGTGPTAPVSVSLKSPASTSQKTQSSSECSCHTNSVGGPIDKFFNNAFKAGSFRHSQATDALAYMICVDGLPFRAPEKKGLRVYTNVLQPLFTLPSEPIVTKRIEAKYQSLSSLVAAQLAQVDALCLTSDIWTDKQTMRSFLGVTAHYLEGTDIKSVEIGAKPMQQRKTIQNIRSAYQDICATWKIDKTKVLGSATDGGSNMAGASKDEFGPTRHVSCFAHALNNLGQAVLKPDKERPVPSDREVSTPADLELSGSENEDEEPPIDGTMLAGLVRQVKGIVCFFRHSEVANTELLKLQTEAGRALDSQAQAGAGRDPGEAEAKDYAGLRLIQESKTRWNSCFLMLERFLHLSEFVSRVLFKLQKERNSTKFKPPNMLQPDEIEALTEVKELLQPLFRLTNEVSQEKNVTLSKCIPLIKCLKVTINNFRPVTPIGFNLKEKLLKEIKARFGTIEFQKLYQVATILDPRFKKFGFENQVACANAIQYVGQLVSQEIGETTAAEQASRSAVIAANPLNPTPGDVWANLDEAVRESILSNENVEADDSSGLPSEFRLYLRRSNFDRKTNPNPLIVWETIRADYPHVYKVARRFLSILATSVPSERLFSGANIVVTPRRSRLTPNHVNQLVFLRSMDDETMWGLPKLRKK